MAVEREIVDGRAFTAQVEDPDQGEGQGGRGRGNLGSGTPRLYRDLG